MPDSRVDASTLAEFEQHLGNFLAERPGRAPTFRADGITVRFGGVTACDDVSIEVNDGEIVALIGPNGAGKTTLFNAVSGLTVPQSGRVRLRGRDISALPAHTRARLGIARTFQQMRPFGTMTAVENLVTAQHTRLRSGFFACGLGLPLGRSEDRAAARRALQILEFLGIADYADRVASTLPYGIQRLIEIGRALALQPSLLLLDEPAAGMGPEETSELATRIRRMRDDMGITVFLIEHDIPFTMALADYIYVLDFGAVIAEGEPAAVRNDSDVKAAYLGQDADEE
jgi:branched-chain amino acid transport system ATP-binding protein